jgi:hypothetical protein
MRIVDVKQINVNRLLLVADGGLVKIIDRNPENNQIEINNYHKITQDKIFNLFNDEEWKYVQNVCKELTLPNI